MNENGRPAPRGRKARLSAPGLAALAPRLALSAGSLLFAYALVEFAVFPFAIAHFSYKLQWRVDLPFLVFCQSTKTHRAPKDYALILGDSYAVGLGEQWDNLNRWTRQAFGSQAVLHARTGRDIITMGHAGAGSLGGLVADPVGKFEFLKKTVLYKLSEPKVVLAYFYEGNDLDNNLRDLGNRYLGKYDEARLHDPAYFKEFIRKAVVEEDDTFRRSRRFHLDQNLIFWKFVKSSSRKLWEVLSGAAPQAQAATLFGANLVRLGPRVVAVPDRLQGPSLEMTPEEVKRGVHVFEQSLRYLREYLPRSRILVVYVPAPLSCYELASDWISVEPYLERTPYHEARKVRPRSDHIAGLIREAAGRAGCGFVDTRPALRLQARNKLLHGGTDWKHLTRVGYAALAEAILPDLERAFRETR
ncbi:MAG: SGNH/GDSL hydrolase family protein [Elusimicrobia bacterium]|nr:SGNH/GDSL hydrolase family protein [Elusimicrobiota bacterium]